ELIKQTVELAQTDIEESAALVGIHYRLVTEVSELPPVSAIGAELRHVLVNLIFNARDAMPQGGTITITGAVENGAVVVRVVDSGIGIPAENLNRVFEPFFTTKGGRGTGLGLSMAYGVMTRLGGSIAASNRPEGGAVFTLTFPLYRAESRDTQVSKGAKLDPGRRVLVIDDDPDNLSGMGQLLELRNYQVDCCLTGREALDKMRIGRRYDLILCDIGMPDMDGWEVARQILAIDPEANIYMLSGWAKQIPQKDERRKLVKEILAKPIDASLFDSIFAGNGGPRASRVQ
ncbi:MAG TPA: ATP-binding protein, partial [Candidatus Binataceae bacterium]